MDKVKRYVNSKENLHLIFRLLEELERVKSKENVQRMKHRFNKKHKDIN